MPDSLFWAWEGYAELSKGRSFVMGVPQSITLTELLAYQELKDLTREETEELLSFVRRLDNVYFEHVAEKQKQEGKKGKSRGRT